MTEAFDALISILNETRVSYAVIGALALIQHGRERTTQDIDVLLAAPAVALPKLFDLLGARGFDVDQQRNVKEFQQDGMTSVRFGNVDVDLLRAVLPVYSHVLDRAIPRNVRGQQVRIGSIEGLILTKLIAMRLQDQADIEDLLKVYRGQLDEDFLRAEVASFTTPDDPRRAKLEEWLK